MPMVWDTLELITLSDLMESLEIIITPGQVTIPLRFMSRRISARMVLREQWSGEGLEEVHFMYHLNYSDSEKISNKTTAKLAAKS